MRKKVVLLLVDSLLPGPLTDALENGSAPNIKAVADAGMFINDAVTVFPTMSCSIDTSLITGVFPHEHLIPGLVWYSHKENRIVNYGSSFGTIWRLGVRQVLDDIIYNLNGQHISSNVMTIFEQLEKKGYTTGNINLASYRGRREHQIKLPFMLNVLTGLSLNKTVKGPKLLSIGKLTDVQLPQPYRLPVPMNMLGRYGNNDDFTIEIFEQIVKQQQLPDFTVAYLPNMDQAIHKHGTRRVIEEIGRIDYKVGKMLKAFGSIEKALEETIWVIISDHGQTDIRNDHLSQINLDELLEEFAIHNFRKQVNYGTTDVIICNNERVAYLYTFRNKKDAIIDKLKQEDRIDFIAYPDGNKVVVEKRQISNQHNTGNYTKDYKLIFYPDGDFTDCYNQSWTVVGDLPTLDLHITDQVIKYGDYPDALMRLYGAVFAHKTQDVVIITAKPSYEFKSVGSAKHIGGASHGSLHIQDSHIPIIIGGTSKKLKYNRIVDIKDFILHCLQGKK